MNENPNEGVKNMLNKYKTENEKNNESLFRKHAFVEDKNNRGNVFILLEGFYPKKNKENYDIFVNYLSQIIKDGLKISEKYDKKDVSSHIDLRNCSLKNFSLSFFKKINNRILEDYPERIVLKTLYVYSDSKFLEIIWKLVKNLVHPDTKNRIKFIKK